MLRAVWPARLTLKCRLTHWYMQQQLFGEVIDDEDGISIALVQAKVPNDATVQRMQ